MTNKNKCNKNSSNKNSSNKNLSNDKKEIHNETLDWIDDYQKEIDNKNNKNNQNKNNNKSKKNKNNKNNKINEKINLDTKLNFDSESKLDSETYSWSESESKDEIKPVKKINNVTNRFGFIMESEESDKEESDKEESDKEESDKEESNEKIELMNLVINQTNNCDKNISLENKENNIKTNKLENKEKLDLDNKNKLIQVNVEQVNIEQENNKNINIKMDKKMIQKQHQRNKNKYKFDLNTKNNLNLSTNSNKTTSNSTNSIVTLYSEKVEVIVGGKKLLAESDIVINAGTKYFVLGKNGIGKTSLLKYVYSKIDSKLDILMIDQDIQIESSEEKISEFILRADLTLFETKKRMDELEKIDEMGDNESEEYNRLSEIVYSREWDKYEAESKRIIDGLGFTDPYIPVSILSGGKRMILAIGKALLRKPDILMLDEPTNHLDLNIVIWLTKYLESYKKTLIVITHQIGLVNSLSDVIWFVGNPELTGNKVYTIRGKYDKLLKFLDQTEKETNKNYEKFTKTVEELRKKSTPKKDVNEFIKKEGVPKPPKPYIVNITFDNVVELSTKNIIEFRDVGFGYGNGLNHIYTGLNVSLSMGSRMILVGPNGCGKTTFYKLINQSIKPTDGYILYDNRLRVGYYNQQIMDNLPLDLNSIQYLQQLNPKLDSNQCRLILGKLGIKKLDTIDLPTNKIKDLSGGQKARVSFASVQMSNPHLILLDEPTNHLDLESIEGLIKGINEFNGGIVVITHDIYLIESIEKANIYQVSNSNILKFPGEFEDYCDMVYSVHEH